MTDAGAFLLSLMLTATACGDDDRLWMCGDVAVGLATLDTKRDPEHRWLDVTYFGHRVMATVDHPERYRDENTLEAQRSACFDALMPGIVERMLDEGVADVRGWEQLIPALTRAGIGVEKFVPLLRKDAEPILREARLMFFSRYFERRFDHETIAIVEGWLSSPDPRVRANAAAALRGVFFDGDAKRLAPELLEAHGL